MARRGTIMSKTADKALFDSLKQENSSNAIRNLWQQHDVSEAAASRILEEVFERFFEIISSKEAMKRVMPYACDIGYEQSEYSLRFTRLHHDQKEDDEHIRMANDEANEEIETPGLDSLAERNDSKNEATSRSFLRNFSPRVTLDRKMTVKLEK